MRADPSVGPQPIPSKAILTARRRKIGSETIPLACRRYTRFALVIRLLLQRGALGRCQQPNPLSHVLEGWSERGRILLIRFLV